MSKSGASADPVALACALSAGDRVARGDDWHELLAGGPVTRSGQSATVVLPSRDADRAAALAVAEQRCCPFFGFTLEFNGETVALTIRVPSDDAAPLLDALLGSDN